MTDGVSRYTSGFYTSQTFVEGARQNFSAVAPDNSINAPDEVGNTPLINALLQDQPSAADVQNLLKSGASVSSLVGAGDYAGHNALTLALTRGLSDDIVGQLILKAKSEGSLNQPDQRSPDADPPGKTPLQTAIAKNNVTAVEILLIYGEAFQIDPLDQGFQEKVNAAFAAALEAGSVDVLKLLIKLGAKPSFPENSIEKALNGDKLDLCKFLIESGAAIDDSQTESMIAAKDPALLKMWLNAGARNLDSDVYEEILSVSHRDDCKLLIGLGAPVDQRYVDYTAKWIAGHGRPPSFVEILRSGHSDMCKFLVSLGTPVDLAVLRQVRDHGDQELLEMAVAGCKENKLLEQPILDLAHEDQCKLLGRLGAPIDDRYINWSAEWNVAHNSFPSFEDILTYGHLDICKSLFKLGAPLSRRTLELAKSSGDPELLKMSLTAFKYNQGLAVVFAIHNCPEHIQALIDRWGKTCLKDAFQLALSRNDDRAIRWLEGPDIHKLIGE